MRTDEIKSFSKLIFDAVLVVAVTSVLDRGKVDKQELRNELL